MYRIKGLYYANGRYPLRQAQVYGRIVADILVDRPILKSFHGDLFYLAKRIDSAAKDYTNGSHLLILAYETGISSLEIPITDNGTTRPESIRIAHNMILSYKRNYRNVRVILVLKVDLFDSYRVALYDDDYIPLDLTVAIGDILDIMPHELPFTDGGLYE